MKTQVLQDVTLVSLNEYFPTFRLTLTIEALRSPETSGTITATTRRHKPEGWVLS
jgi:hypothetical protein